ncbi:hypothetical protein ANN_18115 [Periplaneta americana]|uniref:Neurotransmitter-gated ion-channel ligand-binding domain-containing protein n=1 Tax=Periplaneta americana TaxID=6978 RepID=A0ABQ8SNU2_PERAM|nr:hypothetical protein ANN_18115 [Periplaneta americana]
MAGLCEGGNEPPGFLKAMLMLVTLATYWMEASESERLILAAVDVLCHFGFLMHLGRVLPSNGDKTPLIVTFYRDSMFLATMAVFTTVIVRGLKTASVVLPIWASALSRWVVQTRVGQVLIFHNSNQNVNTSASGNEGTAVDNATNASLPDWDAFLLVFNFLTFVVTLFTYFVLLGFRVLSDRNLILPIRNTESERFVGVNSSNVHKIAMNFEHYDGVTTPGWCDGECKRQAPVTDETRLRNKLKCGYDITVRPQDNENHRNRTEVFLHLLLRHIILDEEYDTIGVYFGLWMYWYDERLKWNPSDYGNIKNIPAESNTIWMPQIGWVTMNIVSDRLYSPDILCTLFHNGHVSCLSRSSFHTVCKSDLTHWPYDSHVCDALMAPWRLPEDELELLASNMGDEHLWADENPHAVEETRHQHRFSINVWVGVLGDRLRPYVLPQRLTGARYQGFVINVAGVCAMSTKTTDVVHARWHRSTFFRNEREHLTLTFQKCWIDWRGPTSRPARSSDLNPLDFWLSRTTRSIQRVRDSLRRRPEECIAMN